VPLQVRFCEIEAADLASHPVLGVAFDCLANSSPLFEVAVDLMVDIFRTFEAHERNLPLTQVLVPRVMGLQVTCSTPPPPPPPLLAFWHKPNKQRYSLVCRQLRYVAASQGGEDDIDEMRVAASHFPPSPNKEVQD
jgi:hypothetical protein